MRDGIYFKNITNKIGNLKNITQDSNYIYKNTN